jgi:hypothetical protein
VRIRFLLDENLSPRLVLALRRLDAAIDVLRVGEPEAPPLATPDPDILVFAEQTQRMLITRNRVSMPVHVAAHLAAGRHHWGIFRTKPRASMADLRDAIALMWGASEAEEWVDYFDWIP